MKRRGVKQITINIALNLRDSPIHKYLLYMKSMKARYIGCIQKFDNDIILYLTRRTKQLAIILPLGAVSIDIVETVYTSFDKKFVQFVANY